MGLSALMLRKVACRGSDPMGWCGEARHAPGTLGAGLDILRIPQQLGHLPSTLTSGTSRDRSALDGLRVGPAHHRMLVDCRYARRADVRGLVELDGRETGARVDRRRVRPDPASCHSKPRADLSRR